MNEPELPKLPEKSPRHAVYPLFALPDVVLFPGVVQPLQIFEDRYLQMVDDLLDGSGRLVLGTVLGADCDQLSDDAPIQEMAGLGQLEDYKRLDDGRYLILVKGRARVVVSEASSDRLYRKVQVDLIDESDQWEVVAKRFREQVEGALQQRVGEELKIPEGITFSQLVDLLLLQMDLSSRELYDIYSCTPLLARTRAALALHERQ